MYLLVGQVYLLKNLNNYSQIQKRYNNNKGCILSMMLDKRKEIKKNTSRQYNWNV